MHKVDNVNNLWPKIQALINFLNKLKCFKRLSTESTAGAQRKYI